MISRRDLIVGAGALAASAGAFALQPRQRLDLMQDRTLATILPDQFGSWAVDPSIAALVPPSEGSLADRLYDEILSKAYRRVDDDGASVMLLGTRGQDQSDALQLHRPEACYPAVGFAIIARSPIDLRIGQRGSIPAVALTAQLGDRIEDIVYWTRIGHDFPRSAAEQRSMAWQNSLAGLVPDGILMRFSAIRRDPGEDQFDRVVACIEAMARAVRPGDRTALFSDLGSALI